jgi:TonB family protein
MLLRLCRQVIALGLLVGAALPAAADIKAYNAAIARGDLASAALEAEGIWPTYDKAKSDAVIVAREFAFTSMRARQPAKAAVYAKWLVQDAPGAGAKDDDPLLAKVLLGWALLGDKPQAGSRNALISALEAWSASDKKAGPVIPATAAADLLTRDWTEGKWEDVRREAPIAASLAAELGSSGAVLEETAKLVGVAAEFLDDRKVDSYFRFADFHDALMERMGPVPPGQTEEDHPLFPLDMRSHAWMESIVSIFGLGPNEIDRSDKKDWQRVRERMSALKGRCDGKNCLPQPDPPGSAPRCLASWDQSPKLKYPSQAMFRGIVGTLMMNVTTDEAGAVTEVKVLAAVPSDTFLNQTIATVKQWKLKKQPISEGPCTLAGTRRLVTAFKFP